MAKRYEYTRTYKNKENNKSTYRTTIYKKIPENDNDMYFVAQDGDRCDLLAQRFYGDATLWWFVARVNNLNSMNIPAGTSLRIPPRSR